MGYASSNWTYEQQFADTTSRKTISLDPKMIICKETGLVPVLLALLQDEIILGIIQRNLTS